jgi:hypothetical protein
MAVAVTVALMATDVPTTCVLEAVLKLIELDVFPVTENA